MNCVVVVLLDAYAEVQNQDNGIIQNVCVSHTLMNMEIYFVKILKIDQNVMDILYRMLSFSVNKVKKIKHFHNLDQQHNS